MYVVVRPSVRPSVGQSGGVKMFVGMWIMEEDSGYTHTTTTTNHTYYLYVCAY